MRIRTQALVDAPPERVWAFIDAPERVLHYMSGMTRFTVVGDQRTGRGARYRVLMRVGSADVGSLVEVVEHDVPRDLAWVSVTGLDQRARWRLRPRSGGRTLVELRLSYGVAGAGLLGWVAERVAAPQVRGHLERSLRQLKREVEHEERRARAAARRATRAA